MSSDAETDEAAPPALPAPKAARKKKLIVIGGAAAVLLLGGGGGGYMMAGGGAKAEAKEAGHAEEAAEEAEGDEAAEGGKGAGLPFDVPPILVNLRSPDGGAHFLKLHVMLVPGPKSSVEGLKNEVPLLLDAYQPFLRELRPEDLSGSAAVFRIKEELLVRARDAIGPDKVKEVLVQDLIQQ